MAQENSFTNRILTAALVLAGIYAFFRWLFTPLLPFLLALGVSALLEPVVQRVRRVMKVRRSFAAVAITCAILLVAGSAAALLVLRLGIELEEWSQHIPQAVDAFPSVWNNALDRIEGWYSACPPFLRSALDLLAASVSENATSFVGTAGSWLMERISGLAAALPGAALFCMTTILALFFTGVGYGKILAFLKRQLPQPWQVHCRRAAQCFRSTVLKWMRSEILLIFVTFLILLLGFWWMGADYALLIAFFTALVDALPVLGTGVIIIPWAVFSLLAGDVRRGISLLILYAAVLLIRSLLEPRLLAGQVNLPPLAVLFAMYLGFHLLGVGGMILLPLLLLLLKQLQDAGIIKLWR